MNRKARRAQEKMVQATPVVAQENHASLQSLLQKANAYYNAYAYDEAYKVCLTVLDHYPYQPDTLTLLGLIFLEKGDMARAEAFFREAITRAPDSAYAHVSYGYALERMGRVHDALVHYRKAYDLQPAQHATGQRLGLALQKAGKPLEALPYVRKTLMQLPEAEEWWLNYVSVFKEVYPRFQPVLLKEDEALMPIITESLQRSLVKGTCMVELGLLLVWYGTAFSRLYHTASGNNGAGLVQAIHEGLLAEALGNPLMQALMVRYVMASPQVEHTLTAVRHILLLDDSLRNADSGTFQANFPAVSALAQQCHINEYIYDETPAEIQAIDTLKKMLEELSSDNNLQSHDCWHLLLYACYRPLQTLHNADTIMGLVQKFSIPFLKEIVEMTVLQPQREMELKKEIPAFGVLKDETSQKVQAMYEANPYPRWHQLEISSYRTLRMQVQVDLPYLPENKLPSPAESPEVLVAGCGTGKQALCASYYTHGNVLAVDLSRSSLAYALYKTRELGVTNIQYMQADILDLAKLGRMFDVVESSGVLHHMRDPMAGWRILGSLLKPGGMMRIGLYSACAREEIVAARELIRGKGYPPTTEGIRACRQEILRGALGKSAGMIINSNDFYSTSECRDLLFHVMEHTYTLPQIGKMLDELGLEFLGMILFKGSYYQRIYQELFPQDKAQMSIANWDLLEQKYPLAFAGMFQFWVRKK